MYFRPNPNTKIRTQRFGSSTLGPIAEVQKKLAESWFPVNPVVLKEVKGALRDGKDREEVITLIKSDPALFMYCIRNLKTVTAVTYPLNPFEALRKLDKDLLKSLLNVSPEEISSHQLSKINKSQALRLQHSLLSSHTAETLAEKVELSPDTAYCASAFRELAMNLFAWNYPQVYSRALIARRRNKNDMEAEWRSSVGVSPSEISKRFASEWQISQEISAALDVAEKSERWAEVGTTDSQGLIKSLREVCEVSELFAETHDILNYPDAQAKWETTKDSLATFGGTAILDSIKGKVYNILASYREESSVVSSLPLIEQAGEQTPFLKKAKVLSKENPFADRCEPLIQELFSAVYSKLEPETISVEAIRLLVSAIIPACGFDKGALYLVDTKSKSLVPSLRIGTLPLARYEEFLREFEEDLTVILFRTTPYKKQGIGIEGKVITQIYAGLESNKHLGLLYFELAKHCEADPQHPTFLHFSALRKALTDCFG